MKKTLSILGAGLALTLALTGCGHEHTLGEVTVDLENHTFVCTDCGEAVSSAHKFDEDRHCEGCGFDIYDEGEGRYNVMGRDEYGATSSDTYYDANGNIESQVIYDTEYDEDGNEMSCKTYFDGVLVREVRYELVVTETEFSHYIAEEIFYDDGFKTVTLYSDYTLNPDSVTIYDADGNMTSQTTYQYEKDEDDTVLYCAAFEDGVMTYEHRDFVDAQGDVRREFEKFYENGEVVEAYTYEHEYNRLGALLSEMEFFNGVLTRESMYDMNEDGWSYLTAEFYYDEEGNITEEYHYDADGNIIE